MERIFFFSLYSLHKWFLGRCLPKKQKYFSKRCCYRLALHLQLKEITLCCKFCKKYFVNILKWLNLRRLGQFFIILGYIYFTYHRKNLVQFAESCHLHFQRSIQGQNQKLSIRFISNPGCGRLKRSWNFFKVP